MNPLPAHTRTPASSPSRPHLFGTIWQRLTAPAPSLADPVIRQRVYLLACTLVVLGIGLVVFDLALWFRRPGHQGIWYGYVFLGASYWLARIGRYQWGAWVLMSMFPIMVIPTMADASNPTFLLTSLVLGVLLGGFLLSIPELLVFVLINLGVIVGMLWWYPALFPNFQPLLAPLAVQILVAGLTFVSMYQRDQLETVRQKDLRETMESLGMALDAAQMGIWIWYVRANKVWWSPRAEEIFGFPPGGFDGQFAAYMNIIYPEDRDSVQRILAATLAGQENLCLIEHRVMLANGQMRWVEGRGQVVQWENGEPVRMTGIVTDITQHKQAEEALQRYAKRLETLHQIDSRLLAAESPSAIAQAAAENVQRLLGCERVSIPIFDFQTHEVTFIAVTSIIPTAYPTETTVLMDSYGMHIIEINLRGEPYLVEDVLAEDKMQEYPYTTDQIRAWLCMPLFYHGELIGSLNLGALQPHFFTSQQLEIAQEVANQLAIALHQSHLSKETAEALLREQRLNKVAQTISGSLELSVVLPMIVRLAVELVGAEAGAMGLITADGNELVYAYLLNLPEGLDLQQPIARGKGVAWRIIEEKKGLLLNDYQAEPSALPNWLSSGLRGMLEVPLIAGEVCLGVLGLYRFDIHKRYQGRDLALAEAIGQQAGITIQNARLFDATERQLKELFVLRALAEAGASASSETQLLNDVAQIVHENLYPDVFGVGLWNEEEGVLRPHPASWGFPTEYLHTTYTANQGVVGKAVKHRQAVRVPDLRDEPASILLIPNMMSEMAVPILAGERLIGVLVVESKKLNAFSKDDERLLSTMAGQLASALERLRAESLQRASEIRRREMLEKVVLLGKTITQITDLDTCLLQIHQGIQQGLGFDRVGMFVYDIQKNLLQGAYGTTRDGELENTSECVLLPDEFIAWQQVLGNPRGCIVVEDYQAQYQFPEDHEMYGVHQHITLAAWAGEKPVALIVVDNLLTNRRITDEDIEALQLFAGYVGLAIENARWNTELEQRVIERTAQLEIANQELESFSYSVSHDLRAPLRAIDGFSTMLSMYSHQMEPESQRYLQMIRDNVFRMTHLINDLLAFSRLSRQPLRKQTTSPTELARQVYEELTPDLAGRMV
ncbi:MAG TPA: GAF domain-containing protein, partial [Anaerolineales bacterium]|nr:GAF domain-containing protein [Anaerolineales bacterium]